MNQLRLQLPNPITESISGSIRITLFQVHLRAIVRSDAKLENQIDSNTP